MKKIRATALVIKENNILVIERHKNGEDYFVLPGGSVEENESPEQAVIRELREETSIEGELDKKVFTLVASEENGREHQIFLAEYKSGEVKLPEDSIEAGKMITSNGDNSYKPQWLRISSIKDTFFRPLGTKEFLIEYL